MIIQKVIPRPVRVKADNTATYSTSSLLETSKEIYELINSWAFDKEEITQILCKRDSPEYITFITEEATRIADGL